MEYRKAAASEIETLTELRKRQLADEGVEPSVEIDRELRGFFQDKLGDGSLVEWVAVEEGEIVATAGIMFYDFPPSYTNQSGRCGYVTNMYTRSEFRGRGIATKLLGRLMDEAQDRGVSKLMLGASSMGRPVYEKFGFQREDSWMIMRI